LNRDLRGTPRLDVVGASDEKLGVMTLAEALRVAYLRGTEDADASLALISKEPLNAKDSPGRVGVIQFFETAGGDAGANVVVKADRFPGGFYDLSRAFSASHNADQQY
jgi:hypothetical protein